MLCYYEACSVHLWWYFFLQFTSRGDLIWMDAEVEKAHFVTKLETHHLLVLSPVSQLKRNLHEKSSFDQNTLWKMVARENPFSKTINAEHNFLDAIASPRTYPCQWMGQWVGDSFRDSYRIYRACFDTKTKNQIVLGDSFKKIYTLHCISQQQAALRWAEGG